VPQGNSITKAQAAQYLRNAGFPESEIPLGVAIAEKESSLNPHAINSVPCYGLWQINMRGNLGVSRRRALGINSNTALFNPAINAKAAYMIWKGAGRTWSKDWTTYKSARASLGPNAGGSAGSQSSSEGFTPSGQKIGFFGDPLGIRTGFHEASETIRKSLWLMLIIILAIILFIMGFVILNRDRIRKLGKTAVSVASVVK